MEWAAYDTIFAQFRARQVSGAIRKFGKKEAEEHLNGYDRGYGDAPPHQKEPAGRAHPRNQRSGKKKSADEAAQVGHVVDLHAKTAGPCCQCR